MKIFEDLKALWPHVQPQRRRQLVALFLLMLLGAGAELVSLGAIVPFIAVLSNPEQALQNGTIQNILRVTGANAANLGLVVSVLFGGVVVIATIIRLALLWASNRFVFGLGYDLGVDVFSKTLHRPYSWHVRKNSSEILGGINKVQMIVGGYLLPLMNATVASVLSIAMVVMLVAIDPLVALVGAGAFSVAYLLLAFSVRKRVKANGLIIAKANNQRIQETQEGIGGIRDVILDSSQAIYVARYSKLDADMRKAQATVSFMASSPRMAIEGLGLLIISVFALFAAKQGSINDLLPVLGALGLGAQKLLPLIQMIYAGWNAVGTNRPNLYDVIQLIDTPRDDGKKSYIEFEKEIRFESVKLHYEANGTNLLALDDIDLTIRKGQIVGIVGKTGSGKSTLVDLLMGLLQPSSGSIKVDGCEIDSTEKARGWSALVAHVPQSIFLSDASIQDNIALGLNKHQIDQARLFMAAKTAELHDFIESLPHGYNTNVGERGVRLSGGQRQRIGIARALYRRSKLLVLDEATSALDDATERKVIDNIHDHYPNLTIVMVAHRLTTLQNCNFIVQMTAGKISKLVTYDEIILTTIKS